MKSIPMPDRYQGAVIPHVMVNNASDAMDFYQQAFGATELFRITKPDGSILHAEMELQGSLFMVGDAEPPFADPLSAQGTSVGLHVYIASVDDLHTQALRAGAVQLQPPMDMFYGARTCMLKDPYGHVWVFLQHTADMAPEEIVTQGENLLRGREG